MREVGVLEARTNLSVLLGEVEATGRPIAITRHGKRIARLEPERSSRALSKDGRPWSEIVEDTLRWADEIAARNPRLAEPQDLRADRDSIE